MSEAPETPESHLVYVTAREFVRMELRGGELRIARGKRGEEATATPEIMKHASPHAAHKELSRQVMILTRKGFSVLPSDPAAPRTAIPPVPPKPPRARRPGGDAFRDRRYAFFGEFASWPAYHGGTPADMARRRGATVIATLDDGTDVVVFGDLRATGRAEAKQKAEKLRERGLTVLDEAAFRALVQIDLRGKRFAFAGGFDCAPAGLEDGLLSRMVEASGGTIAELDAELDYLVVGNRRGPGKIALRNRGVTLAKAGAKLEIIDEARFLELVRLDTPAAGGVLDFASFLTQLYAAMNAGKLGRALDMLRKDRFKLYANVGDDRLVGVVRSQSEDDKVYASWLSRDGHYGCAMHDLEECMGLQGQVCKHLLVLVIGLARGGAIGLPTALAWAKAATRHGPRKDTDLCAETFIQYKGAEAGEIDWRPTETLPEDYYAL